MTQQWRVTEYHIHLARRGEHLRATVEEIHMDERDHGETEGGRIQRVRKVLRETVLERLTNGAALASNVVVSRNVNSLKMPS
jgi:hypothetical protein